MSTRVDSRARVLADFGADSSVRTELLAYDPGDLSETALPAHIRFPLDDEPFVETWRAYSRHAMESGFLALSDRLVQLNFPIQAGISQTEEYRAATRRGEPVENLASATGLSLLHPEQCSVNVHPTWAGAIPAIQTGCREDFVTLLQAFTCRNEPVAVASSQGACIVAGYNNWDRVRDFRRRWMIDNPTATFALNLIADHKDAYQDRFILLSSGSYSGVPPERVRVSGSEWKDLSLTIRREHECAHYWTRRVLSSMKNRVLDEIVADYCGIFAACGRLRADWLLTFLGSDDGSTWRQDGRLHNYRGTPPLSDRAFQVLQRLIVAAVDNLAAFDRRNADDLTGNRGLLLILLTLTRMSLEDIAGSDAQALLRAALRDGRILASNT